MEWQLIAAALVIAVAMNYVGEGKFLLLHLFYLPVVLAGFYLGRYRAGVMAVLSVLVTALALLPELFEVANHARSLLMLVGFVLWASLLSLTATIVGTLSDERQRALQQLCEAHKNDVLTDGLTHVANRRAFEYEMERQLSQWCRHRRPVSLLMLDIDCFKAFNDRYGHRAGDAVLCEVAQLLHKTMRDTDLVARYGGEEFAVILPGIPSTEAQEVAERIRGLIERTPFLFDGLKLRLTVSVGAAEITSGEDSVSLIHRADAALYTSKEAGRNCVHFHNGSWCERFGTGVAVCIKDAQSDESSARASSYSDTVTGLPTAKVFLEELRRRVSETTRYNSQMSVMLASINGFQGIAQHEARAAKKLAAMFGRMVCSCVREADMVARYADDKLAVLLPATGLDDAQNVAHRLLAAAANYKDVEYQAVSLEIAVGLVEIIAGEPPGRVLERLESACRAANAEPNTFAIHDGDTCVLVGETAAAV
jgi:diguanylate cyclase (GGDEF)-like protein